MPRPALNVDRLTGFMAGQDSMNPAEQIESFRRRQREDSKRYQNDSKLGRGPERAKILDENAWRNSEGERLDDFGVDEEVDIDEDNIPLNELARRRKNRT